MTKQGAKLPERAARGTFFRLWCKRIFPDPSPNKNSEETTSLEDDLQNRLQGSNAKQEFTRFRILDNSDKAHFAKALFRRRLDNDVVELWLSMEIEESFSQEIDMHAAVNHEQTSDEAIPNPHNTTAQNMCIYMCVYLYIFLYYCSIQEEQQTEEWLWQLKNRNTGGRWN